MQWSRKTFHFIFPSRSSKKKSESQEKKLREAPCVVVMLCERFARGRAFCFMNFYISMEKSKQKKKKLYSLWSIISIEETHLLYKSSAKKSAAHYRADFKTGHKYPGLKLEVWRNIWRILAHFKWTKTKIRKVRRCKECRKKISRLQIDTRKSFEILIIDSIATEIEKELVQKCNKKPFLRNSTVGNLNFHFVTCASDFKKAEKCFDYNPKIKRKN